MTNQLTTLNDLYDITYNHRFTRSKDVERVALCILHNADSIKPWFELNQRQLELKSDFYTIDKFYLNLIDSVDLKNPYQDITKIFSHKVSYRCYLPLVNFLSSYKPKTSTLYKCWLKTEIAYDPEEHMSVLKELGLNKETKAVKEILEIECLT